VKQVHARLTEDDGFRARFRREVDASRKVSGAYTAAVIDADPDAQVPWLASEFVVGPSLLEAIEAVGPLPEASALRLAAGLAAALADVHRAGLLHRDLKPSNVLLTGDGVRVIDFGIARAADDTGGSQLTHTGWLVGTPSYMAPEQAESRRLTPAGDIFSLGCVLVMACTGTSPFAAPTAAQTLYKIVHSQADLTSISDRLRAIIEPCLAKDPADRPTAARLRESVGRIAPSLQPWPEPIQQMISAQRAEVARFVKDPNARSTLVFLSPDGGRSAVAVTEDKAPDRSAGRPSSAPIAIAIGVGAVVLVGVLLAFILIVYNSGDGNRAANASGTSVAPSTASSSTASSSLSSPRPSSSRLGGLDLTAWCRHVGQGDLVLTADNVYSWHCHTSNGEDTDIDTNAVCRYQYHDPNVSASFTDADNPYTWYCHS
jgi:serine/threonine protein kinase